MRSVEQFRKAQKLLDRIGNLLDQFNQMQKDADDAELELVEVNPAEHANGKELIHKEAKRSEAFATRHKGTDLRECEIEIVYKGKVIGRYEAAK